ncbi:MAG TPA: DUF4352 domain-containing protein [Candidatus Saccharimonadales bacterium]|nr:DUF4352 domain-containing protein [Candidatus Saccharimonadales bacterium]
MDPSTSTTFTTPFAPNVRYAVVDPSKPLPKNINLAFVIIYSLINLLVVGAIVALLIAGHIRQHDQSVANAHVAPTPSQYATATASLGSGLLLNNQSIDQHAKVIVNSVDQSTTSSDPSAVLDAGTHFASVTYTITNTGTKTLSDNLFNDAFVTDSTGTSLSVAFVPTLTNCMVISQLSVAPGKTVNGCVPYEVKNGATIQTVKFMMSFGMGTGDTGIWHVQ